MKNDTQFITKPLISMSVQYTIDLYDVMNIQHMFW